ncbi:H-NS histone family protein [Burkholderia multivorans]|nr:H-NS family nucleoid-associated regulatory protein [Burkholderia multivorans]MCO1451134.1 H-NS histone family protein [Burkholderia multivorans]
MLTDIEALQAQLREVNARLAEVKRDEKRAHWTPFASRSRYTASPRRSFCWLQAFASRVSAALRRKYYDPSTGKEWSGFGPRPKWLVGKNLDDYRVDRAPKPWWPGES